MQGVQIPLPHTMRGPGQPLCHCEHRCHHTAFIIFFCPGSPLLRAAGRALGDLLGAHEGQFFSKCFSQRNLTKTFLTSCESQRNLSKMFLTTESKRVEREARVCHGPRSLPTRPKPSSRAQVPATLPPPGHPRWFISHLFSTSPNQEMNVIT